MKDWDEMDRDELRAECDRLLGDLITRSGKWAELHRRIHLALFETHSWDECNRTLLGIETPHELSLGDHPEDCWCNPTVIQVEAVEG